MGSVCKGPWEASLEASRRHESRKPASHKPHEIFPHTCIPFPQEELVKSATFRYITDAITPNEALAILKAKETTKNERESIVRDQG